MATTETVRRDVERTNPGAVITLAQPTVAVAGRGRRPDYLCECGYALHVSGTGRHRVYFRLTDERLDDPIMNAVCPQCGRSLPGKSH